MLLVSLSVATFHSDKQAAPSSAFTRNLELIFSIDQRVYFLWAIFLRIFLSNQVVFCVHKNANSVPRLG